MTLTLEEKEKLLEKAINLYNEIKKIQIRDTIKINISPKYYNKDSRYADCGYRYYCNGTMGIFNIEINTAIDDLKGNINYNKGKEKYFVACGEYDINALLDFIYNGKYILDVIKETNEKRQKELNDLLN